MTETTPAYGRKPASKSLWEEIGVEESGPEMLTMLDQGLPYQVFNDLFEAARYDPPRLDRARLAKALAIAPATLARRAKQGQFTRAESDRLHRFIHIYNRATEMHGGRRKAAAEWLISENFALGGRVPIDLLDKASTSRLVESLIGRIEHGIPL